MIEIPLTQGKVALIDDEDYELVSQYKWHAIRKPSTNIWYALDSNNRYMHRLIMGAKDDELVDHINHNGIDNRRVNMRLCTIQQNQFNKRKQPGKTSVYTGVSWDGVLCKWRAEIKINGSRKDLGRHKTQEEAVSAYNDAAAIYFGEFALAGNTPKGTSP